MKIKTITCHDVYNVGASLQAYALITYLRSLGHDAEIIDYKPDYLSHHFPIWGLNNHVFDKPVIREMYNIAKLPGRLKAKYGRRKREFDSFTKKYLPITDICYHSNEELKQKPPEADVYFAGSDQIWNTFFQNGRDPAFYLDFAPADSIRASYSASFATEEVPKVWRSRIADWIKQLDFVSVRESSGVELAKKLGAADAVQVLDPVFLLTAKEWTAIESGISKTKPYVLLYDFDRNTEMVKIARRIADQNGWKLYSILPCDQCDRCFRQEGPESFVWLVHHAQFVVSNSFHATAFSLIFQKQFIVFNRYEGINSRMRDLVRLVGIPDALLQSGQCAVPPRIDYKKVSPGLTEEINYAKKYIDRVLSSGVKQ